MVDRVELAEIWVQAQADGTDDSIALLSPYLANDILLTMPMAPVEGKDAVLRQLQNPVTMHQFTIADWDEPLVEDDTVTMQGTMPITAAVGGFDLAFEYTPDGQLDHVIMLPFPAPPLPASKLVLTDAVKRTILEAPGKQLHIVVAVVDTDGQPRLSIRGSLIPYSDTQLAFWARSLESSSVRGLAQNPRITCWYRDRVNREQLMMHGRAAIATNPVTRDRVYAAIPAAEQRFDADRNGGPVVIYLDSVEGVVANERVNLRRRPR